MSKWSSGAAVIRAASLLGCVSSVACGDDFSRVDLAELELSAEGIPDSPTNAYADRPEAAALGRRLFFERGLSSDGTVACADCHDPSRGFSDERKVSKGVDGHDGARHSMPITTAALQPFLLWDGRAGTVWRQPLFALENEREMNFTRTEVARFIGESFRAEYEVVFGPLPDLTGVPVRAQPGDEAWETLDEAKRDAVQRIFVNVGKALEAYERQLVCKDTRFDQWVRGDIELTEAELDGAQSFARNGCDGCHNGPAFSDGQFHNLGLIRTNDAEIDTGRELGRALLLADPLNGASVYSDDPEAGQRQLTAASLEQNVRGAFRTASLRGVTQRARFGHLGEETRLEEFIDDTYRGGGRRGRRNNDGDGDIVGDLDPRLDRVNVDGGDAEAIAVFLGTLECPPLPSELIAP